MTHESTIGTSDVRRRITVIVLVLALLGAASAAVPYLRRLSTADRGYLTVAGNVRTQSYVVRAPIVSPPTADVTVGFLSARDAKPASRKVVAPPSGPSISGLIAEVTVAEGDRVVAGQTLARLDTTLLDLGVQQAETAAAKARADIDVLAGALDTIADKQAELATSKREITATLANARTQRADLAAQLKQLENMPKPPSGGMTPPAGSVPPSGTVPPGGAVPPAGMTPPPGMALPGGALMQDPAALMAKLKAGLAQIDAGIAKMESGLAKMATGANTLADAKTQATNGRELLTLLADTRDVATALARARVDSATLVAPVDGLVTFARRPGTVAMVNAPLFRIAPDTPALIDTYLTAEQLDRISIGSPAEITYDSGDEVFVGSVTTIGNTSAFPPTHFPTEIVHMTRTTRVTITLESGAQPPAGTPVDITIQTGSRS